MANLTLRTTKGSPLTATELDNNFANLNTDIASRLTVAGLRAAILEIDGTGSGIDADLLDGQVASSINTVSTIVARDSSGNFAAGGITASSLTSTNGLAVTGSQTLVGAALGTAAGNQTLYQRYQSTSSNVDILEITNTRSAAGADWQTAGTRLQQKIDATWMSYIQFNGVGNNGGISIGTGQTTTNAVSIPEVFRINSAGNVGIGTISPAAKLEVEGGVSAKQVAGRYFGFGTAGFTLDGTTVNDYGITYTQIASTQFNTVLSGFTNIKFATGQAEKMRIDPYGNVGIGTTSPTNFGTNYKTLELVGTTGGGIFRSTSNTVITDLYSDSAFGAGILRTATNHPLAFSTNNGERMRITASGNVGIGTNTPVSPLDVNGIVTLSLADNYIEAATTGGQVSVNGGTGYGTGGQITLRGSTAADNPGGVDFFVGTSPISALTINNAGVTTVPTGSRIRGIDVGSIVAPGMVVQVATAVAGPTRQTINTSTATAITGLSKEFTPKYANSLIIIQANISTSAFYVSSFGIYKDGAPTVSTAGFTNLNEPNMQVTIYKQAASNIHVDDLSIVPVFHTESAGSTTTRTYTVVATSAWNLTNNTPPATPNGNTLYINDRGSSNMASFSHMFIYEIAQ
jgi:hypothetical protein